MTPPGGVAAVLTRMSRLAAARVAVRSWLDAAKTAECIVCVVDDRFGEIAPEHFGPERVAVLSVAELAAAFPPREFCRIAASLDGSDREGALRPTFLSLVLQRVGGRCVVSIPDDIWIVGEVNLNPPGATALALVLRRTAVVPPDGRLPDAVELAALGRADQSLLAIAPEAAPLLANWVASVRRAPRIHLDRLLPWRHPWLDDLIGRSDVHLIQDQSIATAYWNADERGAAIPALFRFAGFDPTAPWRLTDRATGWPRVLLSEHPALADSARSYARLLLEAGHHEWSTRADGWSALSNGAPIDSAARHAYLNALQHAEGTGEPEPPNPFDDGAAPFLDWLAERGPDGGSRYLRSLAATRPDLLGLDPADLAHWSRHNARREVSTGRALADEHRPQLVPDDPTGSAPPAGINVIGLLRAEFGMGEAARLAVKAAEAAGVPMAVVVTSDTAHRQDHPFRSDHERPIESALFDTDVVVLNADVMQNRPRRNRRRTIGLWFWEVERFPIERYQRAIANVDEIWVASQHVYTAIQGSLTAAERSQPEVHLFPLPAAAGQPARVTDPLTLAGVPADRFIFLFMFDYASVAERKNPWAVIDAFSAAFAQSDPHGPLLVVKAVSGDHHLDDRERLRAAAHGRADVLLLDGFATPAENAALMSRVSCYISLHRAEGWGLTLAEAMALGKPVIATAYSGNLEFMTHANSWLVPAELVPIPANVREYATCGRWADPDHASAVAAMREVVADPELARRRGAVAAKDLADRASSHAGAQFIRARFAAWNAESMPTEVGPTMDDSDDSDDSDESGDGVRHGPIEHPGIGPVVLPEQPPVPSVARGALHRFGVGTLGAGEEMQEWRDRRDHERTVALVNELTETRAAIAEESIQRRTDQATLTGWYEGVRAHLDNLQIAHDALRAGVVETGNVVGRQGEVLIDLRNAVTDARTDLAHIEERLAELTRMLERRANE